MKIAIAADHNGQGLRTSLAAQLEEDGHRVLELGADGPEPIDYPHIVATLAQAILDGTVARGVMIGGTGSGEAIAANKMAGIRAVLVSDHLTARIARENNDANLLVLGAMIVGPRLAGELVATWMAATFTGGRHIPRLQQIAALERGERLV